MTDFRHLSRRVLQQTLLPHFPAIVFGTALLLALSSLTANADIVGAQSDQAHAQVLATYKRLLPLEGGSNFRDLGSYQTSDGKTVKRGLLFRSAAMTGLTAADQQYLQRIGFQTVVDLRSNEERELYPNHWTTAAGISYLHNDYNIAEMLETMKVTPSINGKFFDIATGYRQMPLLLKPQLKLLFDQLLAGNAPLVVNCSAGQDRTGVASALLLAALGVSHDTIVADYLLSTQYRRPKIERGAVDLPALAETNAFARLMMGQSEDQDYAAPLVAEDGMPYLELTFEQIDADYGSVTAYLDRELGIGDEEVQRLRQLYLEE